MKFRYGDELRATVSAPLLDDAPYLAVNLSMITGWKRTRQQVVQPMIIIPREVICGCCPDAQKILK